MKNKVSFLILVSILTLTSSHTESPELQQPVETNEASEQQDTQPPIKQKPFWKRHKCKLIAAAILLAGGGYFLFRNKKDTKDKPPADPTTERSKLVDPIDRNLIDPIKRRKAGYILLDDLEEMLRLVEPLNEALKTEATHENIDQLIRSVNYRLSIHTRLMRDIANQEHLREEYPLLFKLHLDLYVLAVEQVGRLVKLESQFENRPMPLAPWWTNQETEEKITQYARKFGAQGVNVHETFDNLRATLKEIKPTAKYDDSGPRNLSTYAHLDHLSTILSRLTSYVEQIIHYKYMSPRDREELEQMRKDYESQRVGVTDKLADKKYEDISWIYKDYPFLMKITLSAYVGMVLEMERAHIVAVQKGIIKESDLDTKDWPEPSELNAMIELTNSLSGMDYSAKKFRALIKEQVDILRNAS